MKKIKKIWLLFLVLFLGGLCYWLSVSFSPKVHLINVSNYPNEKALNEFKIKLQKNIKSSKLHKDIDVYTGNFLSSDIPAVKSLEHINVLFLGSLHSVHWEELAQYDFIFASTLVLYNYLKANQYKSYLVPSFIEKDDFKISECAKHPENENCFIAVIGQQPEVLQVLNTSKLPYHHYLKLNLDIEKKLISQIQNISAVVVNDSTFVEHSMDTASFIFYAVAHRIPILSDNIAPTSDTTNMNNLNITSLFADTLSYYTYENDIYDFLNCVECRLKKADKAYFLLHHLYTADAVAKYIASILSDEKNSQPVLSDLVTIFSPTHAGLYNNGDYWLSKDLETAFEKIFTQALTVFGLSSYPYLGDVSIYIRGTTPLMEDHMKSNSVSLMYLIFPFTDKQNAYDYALSMQGEFGNVDGVVIASPKVTKAAQQQEINAYYVPQFTNTNKFYFDYEEDKKSEILFVGQNDFYRQAVPAVFKAGLPLTVYGPKWNGLAKGEYIDNKILRKYYSSAKIVLNDTRPNMRQLGFISNRIFDATACGTLVISDYMPEIEEVYGDSVPMWKTEEELIELVKYYLNPEHEAERNEKAKRAQQITLQNFTADIAARKFQEIIDKIKKEKSIP